jgi:hypothetical protein
MNGQFQMLISNPVYGTTPPGIDEVSQEQVFKQMREMNAQMIQGKDFDAFPHQGVTPPTQGNGYGSVTQHHLNQQKRGNL